MLSHFSCVQLHAIPWIQPIRLLCPWGFSRQEYWSQQSFLSPGDLPDPGIEPLSLMSLGLAGRFFTTSATREAFLRWCQHLNLITARGENLEVSDLFSLTMVHNWVLLLLNSYNTCSQFLVLLKKDPRIGHWWWDYGLGNHGSWHFICLLYICSSLVSQFNSLGIL